MREVERVVLLRAVDTNWMNHIDAMDDLRGSVGLQAYAQRNPINEYRLYGADMFDDMVAQIREDTMRMILSVIPRPNEEIKREAVAKETGASNGAGSASQPVRRGSSAATGTVSAGAQPRSVTKIGRNDPCPCGSGKKYKKCCGLKENEGN